MRAFTRSTWFGVSLGILGLVIGYSTVIARNGDVVLGGYVCPATQKECQGGGCAKNEECAKGGCAKDCLGNCGKENV